jgi:hypothetical protein
VSAARRPEGLAPLVVGLAGAAFLLNTSQDKVRELLAGGYLHVVPNLSSERKIAISIVELQRFASTNPAEVAARRRLSSVADAGHVDIDRVLLVFGAFALGVVVALSSFAVSFYVVLIAVLSYSAGWLVRHELRERGRLRDPHRDRVTARPARPAPLPDRPRVEVVDLGHLLVPGPFSRGDAGRR